MNQTIAGKKNLSSIPKLYDLITKEMQSTGPSLAKVGSLISEDISLSAKILQLVNSAFFSLPRRIIDPKQATIYLGSEAVKAIVLTNHIFSSISDEAETLGFNISQMRSHSLMVGVVAGEIARAEQAGKDEIEEAITGGVLKSGSINKFIKGLTALAAVHTANALITQNNCSPGVTVDMLYLKTVNLEDRLPRWVEGYKKKNN